MDIASFGRRESELKLYVELLHRKEARQNGTAKYYTLDELDEKLSATIKAAEERQAEGGNE
jgi:hypothetical protein